MLFFIYIIIPAIYLVLWPSSVSTEIPGNRKVVVSNTSKLESVCGKGRKVRKFVIMVLDKSIKKVLKFQMK